MKRAPPIDSRWTDRRAPGEAAEARAGELLQAVRDAPVLPPLVVAQIAARVEQREARQPVRSFRRTWLAVAFGLLAAPAFAAVAVKVGILPMPALRSAPPAPVAPVRVLRAPPQKSIEPSAAPNEPSWPASP